MPEAIKKFLKKYLKEDLPDIRPGDTVRVYQKVKQVGQEKKNKKPASAKATAGKERREKARVFEGVVLAKKHGKGISATLTVRKLVSGVGVEMIFPVHSPLIEKIEILKRGRTRRAKLYYLRERKGKKAELKEKETETK